MLGLAYDMFRNILWNEQNCSQHRILLLDLADRPPSSLQLNGFDISAKQYPGGLSKNVALQSADALQSSFRTH